MAVDLEMKCQYEVTHWHKNACDTSFDRLDLKSGSNTASLHGSLIDATISTRDVSGAPVLQSKQENMVTLGRQRVMAMFRLSNMRNRI